MLSSWAPYCCNMVPKEFQFEFSRVRHLSPREFVEKLSNELRVRGVVAGKLHFHYVLFNSPDAFLLHFIWLHSHIISCSIGKVHST